MNEANSEFYRLLDSSEFGLLRAESGYCRKYLTKYPEMFWFSECEIFHYTDLSGFIGILSNKGFWLSDARYLNDSEELHNGALLVSGLIKKIILKKRYKQFRGVLEGVLEELKKESFENHFICSFSISGDTLEQWRAYASNGNGVSVGFNLKKRTEYPHFGIGPQYFTQRVIYDDKVKVWILFSILYKYAYEYFKDINTRKIFPDDDELYIKSLTRALSSTFINFKNKAFFAEDEVRIVDSSGHLDFYSKKLYRVSNDMIVPYVCTYDTKLKEKNGERLMPDNLPVSKIIVGPVAKQDAIINSIRGLLGDLGYSADIEIKKSCIPYRG